MNIYKIKTAEEILEGVLKPSNEEEAVNIIHEADFVMEDKHENIDLLFEYYYIKDIEVGKRSSKVSIDTTNGIKSFVLKNYEVKNIIKNFKNKELISEWN